MALIEWSDELSVGIDMIDRQHMILVRAINLLAMAVERSCSNELLGEVFNTLADYTVTHFGYEEELFDLYGYPETPEHKHEHESLLGRVVELKGKWDAGEAELGQEVLIFLVNWLKHHILGSDKKYSAFLILAMNGLRKTA
jgi:hemerythrin-like metal-binding protein